MERMVTVADVVEARRRLGREVVRTPLVSPEALCRRLGTQVWLKLENLQRTGAFKFRGALNCVLRLLTDRSSVPLKLVTASSGNHALGMSLAAKLTGACITVVMPEGAPLIKQKKARDYGAKVVLHGQAYDDAQTYARRLADNSRAVYVPSFNHPDIMAGQGTIALELLEDLPDPDVVLFPIGGGGLAAGMAVVFRALRPCTRLVGVQAEGAASMKASLEAGYPVALASVCTVADGIAVRSPGDLTFEVVKDLVDEVVTVSDKEIMEAVRVLITEASVVPEPAAAAAVAALLAGKVRVKEGTRVVAVLTGGNVDARLLRAVLEPPS
ncbi:MAG TPA: pyridoxal-phosphate dependent enzyme [Firmicutes bacterium]|nr:pyridoxal-phosphate dependent enzyme [Bacillota bacterium]